MIADMKNKLILILLVNLCLPFICNGQHIIKGVIKSATDNSVLTGASVMEVDNSNRFIAGVTADFDGNYIMELSSPNALIRVSFMGFISKDIKLNGQTVLDITLEEDFEQLVGAVVVTDANSNNGMMPVNKRDVATAISSIDLKALENVAVTSIGDLMQGRMSGVDITSVSGDPGAGMSIRIRGTSSLNANAEPLIVIDGVPYETKVNSTINYATATEEEYGAMLDLAPSDIQSIEVLKDAAAAAVWGTQGANGVLIITTKRGTKGRTTFSYDSKFTSSWEPSAMPMLSGAEYAMIQTEGLFNARGLQSIPSEIAYDKSWYNYHNYAQDTDWMKELTQTAFTHEHNVSLVGGGEKARYRSSVGFLDQSGTTIQTGLQRITTRFNMDYDISDRIRFSTDFSYAFSDNDRSYSSSLRSNALKKAPNMAVYEMDKDGNSTGKYFSPYQNYQGTGDVYYNPVALANDGLNNMKSNRVITKFSLKLDIIPEVLQYLGDAAFDFMDNDTRTFFPESASGALWNSDKMNRVTNIDDESTMTQTFNKLLFTPKLGEDHRLTVLGLVSTYERANATMQSKVSNTPSSSMDVISSDALLESVSSQKSKIRQLSFLLNANYVLFDRYILAAGVRADGDSRFGEASRWGYFPFASVAWRISSEPFAENLLWLSDLKLKASYGMNGTPPSAAYGHFSKYGAYGGYIDQTSIIPLNIQLSNLKWETVIQSNIGLDYGFLNNRISGSLEFYSKTTKDAIFTNVKLPSTSGFSILEAQNWGTIDNKGWELFVAANIYQDKDWSVDFNLNLAQNKNIIVDIPDDYDNKRYTFGNGQYAYAIEEGKPMGSIYGYRYLGVYSTNEDAYVKDKDGNVINDINTGQPIVMRPKLGASTFKGGDAIYEDIDKNGIIDEHDIVYLGDSNPMITGGFGPSLKYKNFSLSAFFHFKYGYDVINFSRMYSENMYSKDNQSIATLDRWRKEGDVTNIPRALYNTGYNWLGSDRFVEDASYLRLKTLSLGYSFDQDMLKKANLKSLRLYLTAYNLFTWTNYLGQDPEISIPGGNPFAVSADNSKTPPAKTITLGLSISF